MAAGCSMADMADPDDVYACLGRAARTPASPTRSCPVTYMNSAAALKAFCGEHGGIVCTSSNAHDGARVGVRARREGALLPRPAPRPQHRRARWASRSTRCRSGTTQALRLAGRHDARGAASAARVILWQGHCSVHQRFTVDADRRGARAATPACTSSSTPSAATTSCRPPTATARPSSSSKTIAKAPAGIDLRRRHRDQPRQPPGAREPGQDGLLPRPGRLPLLDDVPHPPGLPRLDGRGARRGPRRQPDRRSTRRRRTTRRSPSTAC